MAAFDMSALQNFLATMNEKYKTYQSPEASEETVGNVLSKSWTGEKSPMLSHLNKNIPTSTDMPMWQQ